MSSQTCPCLGCVPPKRNASCHSSCSEYIDWKTKHDAKTAKIKEAKQEYDDFFISKLKRMRRIRQ